MVACVADALLGEDWGVITRKAENTQGTFPQKDTKAPSPKRTSAMQAKDMAD